MKRKLLIFLAGWLSGLAASAQHSMYVCRQAQAEVFDIAHLDDLAIRADSIRIALGLACQVGQIDSITFTPPVRLVLRERGWWGGVADGLLRYRMRLLGRQGGYAAEVCYELTVADGRCTSARCILWEIEGMSVEALWQLLLEEPTEGTNDPYIYVKQTKTGSRLFEEWQMNASMILPKDCRLELHEDHLEADLTAQLGQRPVLEVMTIVEAWAWQTAIIRYRGDE